MNKIIIAIIVVLVIAGGAFLYLNKYGGGSSSMNMNNNTSTTPTTNVAPNNIVIQNYTFTPGTLTVKAGTEVTWTNQDTVAHSVKSSTFNSSTLNTGDTFKYTFNTPGTYNYSCGIHPTMTGVVVVQ